LAATWSSSGSVSFGFLALFVFTAFVFFVVDRLEAAAKLGNALAVASFGCGFDSIFFFGSTFGFGSTFFFGSIFFFGAILNSFFGFGSALGLTFDLGADEAADAESEPFGFSNTTTYPFVGCFFAAADIWFLSIANILFPNTLLAHSVIFHPVPMPNSFNAFPNSFDFKLSTANPLVPVAPFALKNLSNSWYILIFFLFAPSSIISHDFGAS